MDTGRELKMALLTMMLLTVIFLFTDIGFIRLNLICREDKVRSTARWHDKFINTLEYFKSKTVINRKIRLLKKRGTLILICTKICIAISCFGWISRDDNFTVSRGFLFLKVQRILKQCVSYLLILDQHRGRWRINKQLIWTFMSTVEQKILNAYWKGNKKSR